VNDELAGLLGPGAKYEGDLSFNGRVRVDGHFIGAIQSDDFLEVGAEGRIEGEVDVAQVLVAGTVDGLLRGRERVTLLDTAVVTGQIVTPWLDVRVGARVRAEVLVEREDAT
jgi:cytoskeletal protein CcmA (bactofilin family)